MENNKPTYSPDDRVQMRLRDLSTFIMEIIHRTSFPPYEGMVPEVAASMSARYLGKAAREGKLKIIRPIGPCKLEEQTTED